MSQENIFLVWIFPSFIDSSEIKISNDSRSQIQIFLNVNHSTFFAYRQTDMFHFIYFNCFFDINRFNLVVESKILIPLDDAIKMSFGPNRPKNKSNQTLSIWYHLKDNLIFKYFSLTLRCVKMIFVRYITYIVFHPGVI